jgi:2-polyprenyl-3-methyl-5-hydroxy-6-metoxy-1,4-benzoquinol methylase
MKELFKFLHRPEPFEPSSENMWNHPYISRQMLEAHLDADSEGASRPHDFIDQSVDWINNQLFEQSATILDLGCGPGLYTMRLSQKGHYVTGIDFSENSIAYAKNEAFLQQQNINYLYDNYLYLNDKEMYDAIIMIYYDFGVLSVENQRLLLDRVYQALKPGGRFIFDVLSHNHHQGNPESTSWVYVEKDGFFREEPYLNLESFYRYDELNLVCTQNIVISEQENVCYNIWEMTFDLNILRNLLSGAGFSSVEFFNDATGTPYTANSNTIACVGIKDK